MKMEYGRKGINGAYGSTKGGGSKNPLKGKPMPKGPKDLKPSQKGYVA